MKSTLKHLISFILPVIGLIIIPLCIEKNISSDNIYALITGLLIISLGLLIMILTISMFVRIGKGTLAPWSPTKNLVTSGPYGYVRNPMIIGVLIILLGESIAFLSSNIFLWACIFFIINNIYFQIFEEPSLEKRFGKDYEDYKKNVPRWIPRLRANCYDDQK